MSIGQIATLVISSNLLAFTAGFFLNKRGSINLEKEVQDYIVSEETRLKNKAQAAEAASVGGMIFDLSSIKDHLLAFAAKIKSKL